MHRLTTCLLATLALALSVPTLAASSDYWRWTGADGTVHYGESPPPGVKAERIHVSTGTAAAATDNTNNGSGSDNANSGNGRASSDNKVKLSSKELAEAKKTCEQAKGNLSVLQNSSLVRTTGPDGKQHILSPEEKAQQIQTAKEVIKQYCK